MLLPQMSNWVSDLARKLFGIWQTWITACVFAQLKGSQGHVLNKDMCSSSYYWASVANAPNVPQPYWFSGQRWRCLWTFLFSNVPTFATSLLQEILPSKGGTTWARNGQWILPENARLPRNIQGSFTCRKSTTWDKRLYFPSEGRRAEDFFSPWKIQRLQSGLNPRTWVPKGSMLNLDHRSRIRTCFIWLLVVFLSDQMGEDEIVKKMMEGNGGTGMGFVAGCYGHCNELSSWEAVKGLKLTQPYYYMTL